MHRGDDMVVRFRDRLQPAAVAQLDLVEALGALGQDGIEKELIAALRAFRALADRLTAAMSWPLNARDLVAGERRAIERRVRKVVRRAGRVHGVGNAPAPHELHRTRVERGGARMVRGPSPCSMRRQDAPRMPRSVASASPTGPPPTIRIGVSNVGLDEAIGWYRRGYRVASSTNRLVQVSPSISFALVAALSPTAWRKISCTYCQSRAVSWRGRNVYPVFFSVSSRS